MGEQSIQKTDSHLPFSNAEDEHKQRRSPLWLWLVILTLILFGVLMRFANIDSTPIWHDEALELLHVLGFTKGEAEEEVANRTITFGELRDHFQAIGLNRKPSDVLSALKYDQPGHAPLSFLTFYYWGRHFDYHRESLRQLAILFGLLQIPACLWWGIELTGSLSGGALSAALLAGSPLAIFFSQELRDYPFSILFMLLANAAVMRAYRKNKFSIWFAYALFMALGIYSSILFFFVVLSHIFYLGINEKVRIAKEGLVTSTRLIWFVIALISALTAALPWLFQIVTCFQDVLNRTEHVKTPIPYNELLNEILFNPSTIFCWLPANLATLQNCILAILFPTTILWMTLAFVYARKPVFSFLICTIAPVALFVWLPDLILGGQRSVYPRYYISAPIAVLMLAGYAIQLQVRSRLPGFRVIAVTTLIFLLGIEVFSDFQLLTRKDRGVKNNQMLSLVAEPVSQDRGCLLVSMETPEQTNFIQILALTHVTPPETRLLWLNKPDITQLPKSTKQFYLFNPPATLIRSTQEAGFIVSPVNNLNYYLLAKLP